ncbi:transmembrane protein 267 [Schistocerca nitens]|uniref:transmembrane protein 267 n=1 Tax=Schistocerca nitens TaxID=7011 RepID=UPI002117A77C|nr:transmembrane protein 267 [Schistocerca nitens]
MTCYPNVVMGYTTYVIACLLGIVPVIGDFVVSASDNQLAKSLSDNLTHGVIGFLTWLLVCVHYAHVSAYVSLAESAACCLAASAIDVDHFVAARSVSLENALQLKSRPFLHCTSIPLLVFGIGVVVGYVLKYSMMKRYSWLLIAALLSHHIRDSTRRGLWLWPCGTTYPLPYYLYVIITVLIPFLIVAGMKLTDTTYNYDTISV